MSENVGITIGIPVFNGIHDIDTCLESIYSCKNNILPSFEIIVVDDGSTDGTYEMILKKYPEVLLSKNESNRGVSYSMGFIIDNMKGDYLLRLDSDTIVNAEAINEMYSFMKNRLDVGACTVQLIGIDGKKQVNIEVTPKRPGEWFFDYALWIKKIMHKYINLQDINIPTEIAYMGTGAVLADRESVQSVGKFDENIPFFMEDADWIVRIGKLGKKIFFLPQVSIVHIGGMSGYLYIQTRGRSLRSLYAFYQKHYPGIINRLKLSVAIVAGSSVGLLMALIVCPFGIFSKRIRKISIRALKSYVNVFVWYFARKYATS